MPLIAGNSGPYPASNSHRTSSRKPALQSSGQTYGQRARGVLHLSPETPTTDGLERRLCSGDGCSPHLVAGHRPFDRPDNPPGVLSVDDCPGDRCPDRGVHPEGIPESIGCNSSFSSLARSSGSGATPGIFHPSRNSHNILPGTTHQE